MCEMMVGLDHSDSEKNNKEHQLEHILSENLRMLPDKYDEVDKYGLDLRVDSEDDNSLHIENHKAFIVANTLKPQYKSRLQAHIKKHEISEAEKKRMGLDKTENDESNNVDEKTSDNSSIDSYGDA